MDPHQESRRLPWLDGIVQDIRYAIRALARSPGFTLTAVAMLALGIGVNATVFTVTNAVLFKGFPMVTGNDRLAYVSGGGCCVSYPDFEDYRSQAKSFDAMAIVHGIGVVFSDNNGYPENLSVTEVSADTFSVVGQRPLIGRDFTVADEISGAAPVAILSYGFWGRRYAKDQQMIGRTVRINGAQTTVIGVMPEGFSFPQVADLWVPLVKTAEVMKRDNRGTWCVVGRLANGVTLESARVEIQTIARQLAIAYPLTNRDFKPLVQSFAGFFIGPDATLIYGSMWGAVGFVLLIACANLANLLLARSMERSREISVRIALGSGRWRIIRQLLVESVLLSGLGGVCGWWVAKWGVSAYQVAMTRKSSWLIVDYTMDHRVLAYLIAISIGTGLLFGFAPALQLSKLDINSTLKDGSRGSTGGRRLSALLVTGEMALAIVLLAGAGVMIRSFLKIHTADMGVQIGNVLMGAVTLPQAGYPRAEAQTAFFDRVENGLQAVPGVESAALANAFPSWPTPKRPYELSGAAPVDERSRPKVAALVVSPAYFRTLGATLLAGREFNNADRDSAPPVVIVNQRFAANSWPGEEAIGKRIRLFSQTASKQVDWLTVVGVVSNIIQNDQSRQRFDPVIYVPYRQNPAATSDILVRTRVPPTGLVSVFRREVLALDPDLPMYGPFVLSDRLEMYWDNRFYGFLFLIFAAIALLLASIGQYTVIAHSVSQRTQEIGIRMAIGANTGDILKLVLRQGMLPLGSGLIIGLAASFAVNRLLRAELVQVSPSDPITLFVASATLILSATLGCLIPARRAMSVDPVIALRHE